MNLNRLAGVPPKDSLRTASDTRGRASRTGPDGCPICANLVRAGYRVQAGDRRPEAAELATRCGAQWVSQIARLAAESDVLITVLPGPGEVREVMLGPGGVLEVLRRGTTWIDMTSNPPAAMTEISKRCSRVACRYWKHRSAGASPPLRKEPCRFWSEETLRSSRGSETY